MKFIFLDNRQSLLRFRFFNILLFILQTSITHADVACVVNGVGSGGTFSSMEEAANNCSRLSDSTARLGPDIVMDERHFFGSCQVAKFNGGWMYTNPPSFSVECTPDSWFADANELDQDDQNNGKDSPSSCHPINIYSGNKYKIHTDIDTVNSSSLPRPGITRTYNSQLMEIQNHVIGVNWHHSYQKSISLWNGLRADANIIGATPPSGSYKKEELQSTIYIRQQDACEAGFEEIKSKATSASGSPFSGISRFLNGSATWESGKCIVRNSNGRYITDLPILAASIVIDNKQFIYRAKLNRPDGKQYIFEALISTEWTTDYRAVDPGMHGTFQQIVTNTPVSDPDSLVTERNVTYIFTDENQVKETYNQQGQLIQIEYPNEVIEYLSYVDTGSGATRLDRVDNNFGKFIVFTYDESERVGSITDDISRSWQYQYDTENRLILVINPDSTQKNYHYEDSNHPFALTGLTDERNIRYSTFTYTTDGMAESSYLGAPDALSGEKIEGVTVAYGVDSSVVIDSRSNPKTYRFTTGIIQGLLSQVEDTDGNVESSYSYDDWAKQNLVSKTEYNINTKFNFYDIKGKPGQIVEAVATPEQRSKEYIYDPRFHNKIATITEPSLYPGSSKITTHTYDDYGSIISIAIDGFTPDGIPVSRSSTFKYNGPFHQISEANGPRIDVNDITYFDYYPNDASQNNNRARLSAVRTYAGNYLRQNIQYTATGKVASEDRPNSLHVSYLYYPGNDRLKDIVQIDAVSGAIRTVRYTYLATGEVESITQGADSANAVTLTLSYDNARRLTRVTDGLNNYIEYILDTEGNVENENIYDSSGNLKKTISQTFDSYNRLENFTQVNEGKIVNFNPDGTINTITDGKGVLSDYSYDSLKRLTSVIEDKGGENLATANALTQYTYDAQDNLTSVKDANNGETVYVYDDLGNLLSRTSPDTGTVTYQYDSAGNIVQSIDAKSQLFTYTYNVNNRLTSVIAPVAEDSSDYTYDNCLQGYGKICSSKRHNSQLTYQYNAFGDVTSLGQSLVTWAGYNTTDNNVKYGYDAAGHLESITYPSGAIANYTHNAAGKIDNVSLDQNGSIKTLSLSVNYLPFGGETVQTYGNGVNVMGFYDQAYRPFIVGDPSLYYEYIFGYDANGNIDGIRTGGQGAYFDSAFSYDEHQRLISSSGFHNEFTYNYDLVGNKLAQNQSGTSTTASYSPKTNQLVSLAGVATNIDDNGNIENLRDMSLTYTADNRLKSTNTGVSFEYHAQGQRSIKHSIASGYAGTLSYHQSTSYIYGLNGELLAEVGPTGSVKKEYVYLNNKPLAMLDHRPDSNEPFLKADLDNDGEISVEDFLIWYFNHRTDNAYEVTGDGVAGSDDINVLINCGLTQGNCVAASFSTDIYYIHNDHLGTPKMLTNSSRAAVWRSITTPFGKAAINDDVDGDGIALEFNIRQPGQYYDRESGLYYNYYRYYDPETGRYITSDPIGLAGGVNTYSYVRNNPIGSIDPYGLFDLNNHVSITVNAALNAGMTQSQAHQLGVNVANVDALPGSQDPSNSHMHAMACSGEDRMSAQNKYTNYVNSNLASGTQLGLAKALHAIQDFYAAGHSGFQEFGGMLELRMISHWYNDGRPSADAITAATIATQNAIGRFNGN